MEGEEEEEGKEENERRKIREGNTNTGPGLD